jgi:cyclase
MHRTLIVARLRDGARQAVADVFAESDRGELPGLAGVAARSLFTYRDLYFHLIESDGDPRPALEQLRDHPLFTGISARLSEHIAPYDPGWRGPRDAMAEEFYRWAR